jgi:hypothetical protein
VMVEMVEMEAMTTRAPLIQRKVQEQHDNERNPHNKCKIM